MQRDCRNEPPYPYHRTVVFSLSAPTMTAHIPSNRCAIEHPHEIADCGEWQD